MGSREAEEVAEGCVTKVLKDVETEVFGELNQHSSCSMLGARYKDEKQVEDHRLVNWKRWLKIRETEGEKLRKATYRDRKDLLLNLNPNDYRKIQKRKEIIDKSAANFGALNFWNQPEKLRNDLQLTLPKAMQDEQLAEIIYTQTPDLILNEQRIRKATTPKPVLNMMQEKIRQEVEMFEPSMAHLALKGNDVGDGLTMKRSFRKSDSLQLSQKLDKFKKIEKLKALAINGIKINSNFPDKNVLIDIIFEGFKIQRVTKTIRFENYGEIAVNLTFKKVPASEADDIIKAQPKMLFFNKSTFRIIPGDVLDVPFHFCPIQTGIYEETLILVSEPQFSSECDIQVSLLGHCVKKYEDGEALMAIAAEIEHKAAEIEIEKTIRDIEQRTVRECKPPRRELFKDHRESAFITSNPNLFYHPDHVQNLTQIFCEVSGDESEWNYDIDELYQKILGISDLEAQKEVYERFLENHNPLHNVKPNISTDDTEAKFSMVKNVFGSFFKSFEDVMHDGSVKSEEVKTRLKTAVNKMICILES